MDLIFLHCHCQRPKGAQQSYHSMGLLRRFAPRNDILLYAFVLANQDASRLEEYLFLAFE
jgi:hypothetical protein